MRRTRDTLARYNERVKLFAGFLNAIALGLIGFAVLRPLTDDLWSVDVGIGTWALTGLAIHGAAHYVLGRLAKEIDDDPV